MKFLYCHRRKQLRRPDKLTSARLLAVLTPKRQVGTAEEVRRLQPLHLPALCRAQKSPKRPPLTFTSGASSGDGTNSSPRRATGSGAAEALALVPIRLGLPARRRLSPAAGHEASIPTELWLGLRPFSGSRQPRACRAAEAGGPSPAEKPFGALGGRDSSPGGPSPCFAHRMGGRRTPRPLPLSLSPLPSPRSTWLAF